MRRAPRGEILRLHPVNHGVQVGEPGPRQRRVAGQHVDIDAVRAPARRGQVQVILPLPAHGGDDRPEGAVQQRVGLGKAVQALDLVQHPGPDRLDVVVIPANAIALAGQHRIRLDEHRRVALARLLEVPEHVARLHFRDLLAAGPRELDADRGGQGLGAVHRDVDDRMVGVHPDPDLGALGAGPRHQVQRRLVQAERLAEGPARRERVRRQMHAHLADLGEAGVVIPRIRFSNVELQVARRVGPRIQRDVAVAQGHRAVMVFAGSIPDHIIGARWHRPPGARDQRQQRAKQEDSSGLHRGGGKTCWGKN